ncbi:hypothetical protein L227DRAFT_88270 [Lentinus tigrinus ALCF2SS1-6]|uniref:Uncharacterized protein n=1 Tax=Lentinus tigrinus ALCF2SS1-6 TaxID=1328759 RepID=A0A5C2SBJ4_9APHY|nr:hypothetical protein L227DRAFT_88270 [Lentinus tigrinus ALCF2SS1-6]
MSDSDLDGESSQSIPNLKSSRKRRCHIQSDNEDDGDYEEADFSKDRSLQARLSDAEAPTKRVCVQSAVLIL